MSAEAPSTPLEKAIATVVEVSLKRKRTESDGVEERATPAAGLEGALLEEAVTTEDEVYHKRNRTESKYVQKISFGLEGAPPPLEEAVTPGVGVSLKRRTDSEHSVDVERHNKKPLAPRSGGSDLERDVSSRLEEDGTSEEDIASGAELFVDESSDASDND